MRAEFLPEGRYLVDFDTHALPRYLTDVAIVGAGIAGLSAALSAAADADVLLLLKDEPGVSNTAWAQGGVAAAVSADDSAADHAAETVRGGCGLADLDVVESVTHEAPEAVARLVKLGARFDRREDGTFDLGHEGGHGQRRVLRVGDKTGEELDRVLVEAVRASPNVRVLPRLFVVDLLTADGRCIGVVARRANGELCVVLAKAVILASGGAGRLYRETSNVRGATGDGIAAAFRAGAVLRDLEFVQFHPTTLYLAGSERVLVTEAVRGEGAHLVDNLGERFLRAAHPAAELAPRDVVSRAIVQRLALDEITDVFLDMRHWPAGHAARHFPHLVGTCAHYGLDPERDLVPVRPAAHYFIGGVATDLDGKSSLPGLFACGEASCSGMHGANRLASNSLLEGLVLGGRAGRAAAAAESHGFRGRISHRTGRRRQDEWTDLEDLRDSLSSRMWRSAGVLREESDLQDAAAAIHTWRRFLGEVILFSRAGFELENMLALGELVTLSALLRKESRGVHGRTDHPERDDDRFLGHYLWRSGESARFEPLEACFRG